MIEVYLKEVDTEETFKIQVLKTKTLLKILWLLVEKINNL